MAYGYTTDGRRVYQDDKGTWLIEERDGTVRQATPEEIDEAYGDSGQ
ncbi:hypothetical protein [Okeania sp. SIO1I7]|nr:hypothetical protein [Okeania sp. SIO1I7]NET28207.1 hypothetical protein [Okeania sp. SIO1I7]